MILQNLTPPQDVSEIELPNASATLPLHQCLDLHIKATTASHETYPLVTLGRTLELKVIIFCSTLKSISGYKE